MARYQKISINAGFSCPNRDGRVGRGGCSYCNNQSFVPEYCLPQKSISQQIEEGIIFFKKKYPDQKYIAYFQSYTNTYAPLESLKAMYEEALSCTHVEGIAIGTRPDCVDDDLLDYLAELNNRALVIVEYGVESTSDLTLQRINRGHDYACAVNAIQQTAARGIQVVAHLILGLPGEDRDLMMTHAQRLSLLPLTGLKLHQLQLIKGTRMAQEYVQSSSEFRLLKADEYIDLVIDFLEYLNPAIHVERFVSQSPKELLIAPDWGLKNYEFADRLRKRIVERESYQGRLFRTNTLEEI